MPEDPFSDLFEDHRMKPMLVSEDILPLAEVKSRISAVLRRLRQEGRPIVITQNGKPAAVLMSPDQFDDLLERRRFVASINRGLRDSRSGRVVSDKDLGEELNREFGAPEKS